ncbi:hypothetical protein F8388_019017 [Cannabis sativa]|uniref:Negative regulator of systemic acquired resistance SNI1 n=1 Tax=Cannabis sativa TaxID=3483 RepID=A0A7J6H1R7_CANSA|nr:hypothetical protein F8388_019017 [Cannabis sativa]
MEVAGIIKQKTRGQAEENILAIINGSGAKDTQEANEDSLAFLEAVRAISIVSLNGTPPTNKMFQEVFRILRCGESLELIMASYKLLTELDKSFPRVYFANVQNSLSDINATSELVVANEGWSPFDFSPEFSSYRREGDKDQGGPVDSYEFHCLIQDLARVTNEMNFQKSDTKSLRNLLLFQYLVNILEGDFVPRNSAYNEGLVSWTPVKESLLNMLLSSEVSEEKSAKNCDTAVILALPEVGKNACISMQKFLTIIMELDSSKKNADKEGSTTRADGIRTPMVELIVDELTYNRDIFHPFLQVYDDPKWKLELVVLYLWKYVGKCFSDVAGTKSAIKKIGTEVIQLLLVHGFQAYLSLPCENLYESISAANGERTNYFHIEICKSIISAFRNLRAADKHMEITSFGKEALFTAATIISMKS